MLQIRVKLMGMSTKDNATVNLHIMTYWPTWRWEKEREALHRVQECCDRSSSVHKEQKGRSSNLCWSKKGLLSNNFYNFYSQIPQPTFKSGRALSIYNLLRCNLLASLPAPPVVRYVSSCSLLFKSACVHYYQVLEVDERDLQDKILR